MLSGIRGMIGRFVALAATFACGCALFAACSLNPQPIPPGATAADAGSYVPTPNEKSGDTTAADAGSNETPSAATDAGGGIPDGSQVFDQDAMDGMDGGVDGAIDGASDALVEGGD